MARKKKTKSRGNGQGTVFKDRNKFRWQYVIPGTTTRIGGSEATREAAELALVRARADYSRGLLTHKSTGQTPMNEYIERWLYRPRGWSPNTLQLHELLYGYLRPHFEALSVEEVSISHVRDTIHALSAQRSRAACNFGATLAPDTVRRALWLVRAVLNEAVQEELIPRNPALLVTPPKPPRGAAQNQRQKALDLEEARRFVALGRMMHEEGLLQNWPALYTMISVGLRRGETAALTWEDVDFANKTISIRQTVNGRSVFGPPKTPTSRRTIALIPSVEELLRSIERDSPYVFGHDGRHCNPITYTRAVSRVITWSDPDQFDDNIRRTKKAPLLSMPSEELMALMKEGPALTKISVHGLRHTFATTALRQGVSIEVVSRTLGHAKISMTLDRYRHVLESEWREKSVDLFG